MRQEGKKNLRWNTMKILAVGFLGVILIGAVLLWLPICNEKPISFLDALFTSTTSVCVTGLITIVPKYQFTIVGKVVLLLLIQIGGLGIVACVAAFFMIMRRKITLKERIVIQETYNMDSSHILQDCLLQEYQFRHYRMLKQNETHHTRLLLAIQSPAQTELHTIPLLRPRQPVFQEVSS